MAREPFSGHTVGPVHDHTGAWSPVLPGAWWPPSAPISRRGRPEVQPGVGGNCRGPPPLLTEVSTPEPLGNPGPYISQGASGEAHFPWVPASQADCPLRTRTQSGRLPNAKETGYCGTWDTAGEDSATPGATGGAWRVHRPLGQPEVLTVALGLGASPAQPLSGWTPSVSLGLLEVRNRGRLLLGPLT